MLPRRVLSDRPFQFDHFKAELFMGKAADVLPAMFTVEVKSIRVFCNKPQPSLDVSTGRNLLLGNTEQATANTGASFGF